MKKIHLSLQQQRIVKEMLSRKFITTANCISIGGGVSLQKRLSELRNIGFIIGQTWVKKNEKCNGHNIYWIKKMPKGIIL